MTNEDIIKQFEPNKEYPSYYHESNVLEAMDAARQDAREQVINELVVLMEDDKEGLEYDSWKQMFDKCITHAKSLLNQQGAVEKTYGEKLIDAIEKLEQMGLWEEWKEENPSKVNALKKLINEKSNQQGEETKLNP